MKQKFYPLPLLYATMLLLACGFLTPATLMASGKTLSVIGKDEDGGKKSSRKEKSFKNQNVVRVYPDVIKKSIHVVARSGNEKEIEFLVFDINGNMVLNYKMKAGEKKAINKLKKGDYMYHVFSDDEYLTTGKIEFR